jgi:ribosomal protein S18
LHDSKLGPDPAPFRQYFFRVAARVQERQHANFLRFDSVKNAVGKTVQIQPAHVGETYRIKQRTLSKTMIRAPKILGEFQPQAGTLVFVPTKSELKISPEEPVLF